MSNGDGSVRFVRIGNRIVPIRNTSKPNGESTFARKVAKASAATGAAATTTGVVMFAKGSIQMAHSVPRAVAAHTAFGPKSSGYQAMKLLARKGAKKAILGAKLAKVGAVVGVGGVVANSLLKRFQKKKGN